jgi:hypothetical protein
VLSGAPENALSESDSTLLSSRRTWEQLESLGSTGEVYRSVWEVVCGFRTYLHFADEGVPNHISISPIVLQY